MLAGNPFNVLNKIYLQEGRKFYEKKRKDNKKRRKEMKENLIPTQI